MIIKQEQLDFDCVKQKALESLRDLKIEEDLIEKFEHDWLTPLSNFCHPIEDFEKYAKKYDVVGECVGDEHMPYYAISTYTEGSTLIDYLVVSKSTYAAFENNIHYLGNELYCVDAITFNVEAQTSYLGKIIVKRKGGKLYRYINGGITGRLAFGKVLID